MEAAEVFDDGRHSRCHLCQRLPAEGKVVGVGEVPVDLAGEQGTQVLPGEAGPPVEETPLAEAIVGAERGPHGSGDRFRGCHRPFERRGGDHDGPAASQLPRCGRRLRRSPVAQLEAGESGVDEMGGVVDFPVADEMDTGQHGTGV